MRDTDERDMVWDANTMGRAAPGRAVPEQLYSQRDYGSGNIVPDDWLEAAQ